MVVIGCAIQLKLKVCPFKLYLLSKQPARSSDIFGMNFRTVEKQNKKEIFCHLLHFFGEEIRHFCKNGKNSSELLYLLEVQHQTHFSLLICAGLASSNNTEVHPFHSVKAENYTNHTNK
jgi:hypothetical protein